MLAFFISSSLLSTKKTSRNHRQVLANGGVAALAALAGSRIAFAGALAAAAADTWASEIGRHSRTLPRLIPNGRPVPIGTDGGMTLLGTAGGIAGAVFIAGLGVVLPRGVAPGRPHPGWFVTAVAHAPHSSREEALPSVGCHRRRRRPRRVGDGAFARADGRAGAAARPRAVPARETLFRISQPRIDARTRAPGQGRPCRCRCSITSAADRNESGRTERHRGRRPLRDVQLRAAPNPLRHDPTRRG